MDKQPWSEIRHELIQEKKIDELSVDLLAEFVQIKGIPIVLKHCLSECFR